MSARDSPQLPPTCLQALCTPFQKMKIDAIALVPGFLHFHCVPPQPGGPAPHAPPPRARPSLALSQGGSLPAAPPSALCQRPRGPERGRDRQAGPGEEGGAPAERPAPVIVGSGSTVCPLSSLLYGNSSDLPIKDFTCSTGPHKGCWHSSSLGTGGEEPGECWWLGL